MNVFWSQSGQCWVPQHGCTHTCPHTNTQWNASWANEWGASCWGTGGIVAMPVSHWFIQQPAPVWIQLSQSTHLLTHTHMQTHMHFHASKSAWYSANCCFCHCWVWPSASVCMWALLTVNISRRSCLLHAGCVYGGCTDAQRLYRRLCWWSCQWTPRAKLYWHLAARTFFSWVLGEFTYLQIHSSSYLLRPEQVAKLPDPFHLQRISD